MTGLALEGGGTRGSYQAGAYIAFLECHIKIDGVCGTSIGALNGAIIAENKGLELPNIWRNHDMGKIFGFTEEYVEALNKKNLSLQLFKSGFINFLHIITNKGIQLDGLKNLIDEEIDVDALINSDIDFGLVTVRLKDFKPIYLFKKDMPKDKIKDYLLASSCLPIFKMEKLIDDNYYLDGGFYDIGPVNMLLEKGYDKVYLIKIHGVGIRRKYDEFANVTVIEPKRNLGGVLDLNKKRIWENIQMGYYDTLKVLKNLDGDEYVFKRKTDKYYERLNKKVPERELRRIKNFFKTTNTKIATIKAVEYIMKKEEINYYDIYNMSKTIRKLKKLKNNKNHFINEYLKKLRVFF